MNAVLPDVSVTDSAPALHPLEWVGMQGIDLPVTVAEGGYQRQLHARADVQVDLPLAHIKGIHMSRLYRLLDEVGDEQPLSAGRLRALLQAMIDSHSDCGSQSARLRLNFDLLVRRPALKTPQLSGWKSYPVRLDALLQRGTFRLHAQITVGYSSTCPCSAALSRQIIEQSFSAEFGTSGAVDAAQAAAWLRRNASLATPHSQRSEAVINAELHSDDSGLGLLGLIDITEQAINTPLQTAVKRADEQAFAELNGQNLMFVEDAARHICTALGRDYRQLSVHVRHLESLHPHDAVAWASSADRRAGGGPL